MKYSWGELDRIIEILEDEASGHEIDRREVLRLLEQLTNTCPDIANTLSSIRLRMSDGGSSTIVAHGAVAGAIFR